MTQVGTASIEHLLHPQRRHQQRPGLLTTTTDTKGLLQPTTFQLQVPTAEDRLEIVNGLSQIVDDATTLLESTDTKELAALAHGFMSKVKDMALTYAEELSEMQQNPDQLRDLTEEANQFEERLNEFNRLHQLDDQRLLGFQMPHDDALSLYPGTSGALGASSEAGDLQRVPLNSAEISEAMGTLEVFFRETACALDDISNKDVEMFCEFAISAGKTAVNALSTFTQQLRLDDADLLPEHSAVELCDDRVVAGSTVSSATSSPPQSASMAANARQGAFTAFLGQTHQAAETYLFKYPLVAVPVAVMVLLFFVPLVLFVALPCATLVLLERRWPNLLVVAKGVFGQALQLCMIAKVVATAYVRVLWRTLGTWMGCRMSKRK